MWGLEAERAHRWCRSQRLLHLRLWIRYRVHDGGGDGNWGLEVIRDLEKKKKKTKEPTKQKNSLFMLLWLQHAEHNTQLLQTSQSAAVVSSAEQITEPPGQRNNRGRQQMIAL